MWLVLRLFLIAFNIYAVLSLSEEESNLDWGACILISTIGSVTVFGWLMMIRNKARIDWSEPYSWTAPFFPMRRYPLRFWFTSSVVLMVGGLVEMSRDLIFHIGKLPVGGTFFIWGLFLLLSLMLWIKKIGPVKQ